MLDWLYTAVSWVLEVWHSLLSTVLPPAGGVTWALSVVLLVVTVRVLLFPLAARQVAGQRAMQELHPEIDRLRTRHGDDTAGFSKAVLDLQRERGVNPLAGCLPVLPQIPVFLGLLHVLRRIAPGAAGLYGWSTELTRQAAEATLLGAPVASSSTAGDARLVAVLLLVATCATTFWTQRQMQRRSGPVEGQAATVQKVLLYGTPVGLFASGLFFPILVLLYWITTNLWTLGQQSYLLRRLPPPQHGAG
ncbi:YidC/Oxa1 family membrane protein insertase [Klenkia soli]|uniref:Membrane protein insertase YidC n=1 Tax=Klenkia soli TaxID=1052260 RepID=A0A1H0RX94_9ACTN|nr:membrane protein insertase YidC [Klenkia soli]SDP33636.1 YidC/Oxa1 family membrane protein insertase [Klenkia soli]